MNHARNPRSAVARHTFRAYPQPEQLVQLDMLQHPQHLVLLKSANTKRG
ncbi:hypothetical protein HMPREF0682_2316 [Propionibacterium acidifaciens F0233]|uniref:Uncharacterized protein n=1 Tax=Propionibacterium acidifaciens F0233 TaxID=553198 RepID=U2QXV2_9ACTN|nr:hypothetical protein HMPREF0682_2316 [Propionibacterium acidifaciens F0233]